MNYTFFNPTLNCVYLNLILFFWEYSKLILMAKKNQTQNLRQV